MEIEDCAYTRLGRLVATDSAEEAFAECDVALLVGAMPRKEGMERKDLLRANARIFKEQGQALARVAKPSVRVLVVGNPANTNALIVSHYAPGIGKENFSALTRLDQNRASGLLARTLKLPIEAIRNVIIFGNHSSTQFPDIAHARVEGTPVDARDLVGRSWYEHEFIRTVQTRGAAVIAARKLSSACSAAKAIADHLDSWLNGTPLGEYCSMAVCSDGEYGCPEGLFFSYPVTCHNASWTIVADLELDDFGKRMIQSTVNELVAERDEALEFLEKQ